MPQKPYLIFDFDSTVIKLESLEEIAGFALEDVKNKDEILGEISRITNSGMEGELSFKESLKRRLALFKINRTHIEKANDKLLQNITHSFLKNAKFLKDNTDRIYIISGGFDCSIVPIVQSLGLNPAHIIANKFIFDEKSNVSGIEESSPLLKPFGKSLAVSNLKLAGEIIIIGDGYTDYQLKESGVAKRFIAFCENVRREKVIEKADFVAKNLDEVIEFVEK